MKIPFSILIILNLSISSFGQEELINEAIDSACECLTIAIETPEIDTKFDFEYSLNTCLDSLFNRAERIDASYNDINKKNSLIQDDLKNRCSQFNSIDSLRQFYASHAFESIATSEDCSIMKSGTFVTYGDRDSTKIIMSKKIQTVEFKSGAYTKSKIVWIDSCSYKLIRIKSTDPYESQMVKRGEERLINIIHVSENGTVYYEILVHGKAYAGRLIKISN